MSDELKAIRDAVEKLKAESQKLFDQTGIKRHRQHVKAYNRVLGLIKQTLKMRPTAMLVGINECPHCRKPLPTPVRMVEINTIATDMTKIIDEQLAILDEKKE